MSESETPEQFFEKKNPGFFSELTRSAERMGVSFKDALIFHLDGIRNRDLALYQGLKAKFPALLTDTDVREFLNLEKEGLGKVYYDANGELKSEGWLARAIELGPDGAPIISDRIRAYDPRFIEQLVLQLSTSRFSLGVIQRTIQTGIENYDGAVDPSTATQIALTLKGRSGTFNNARLRSELENRVVLGFAHYIQTAQTKREADARVAELEKKFTFDRDGVISDSLKRIKQYTTDWDVFSKVGAEGRFPKLHQYLRGAYVLEQRAMLLADCTGSGKTGSIATAHYLLSDCLLSGGKKRRARTLVIAPPQPAVSAWNQVELNGKYAQILGRPHDRVRLISRQSMLPCLEDLAEGILVLPDSKLSYLAPKDNPYVQALLKHKDLFDIIAIDECQLAKNRSNRTSAIFDILSMNKRATKIFASATPALLDVNDFRNILSFLDPAAIPDPRAFDLFQDLDATREIIRRKSFTFTKEDLSAAHRMPKVLEEDYLVQLSEADEEAYSHEWTQLYASSESDVKKGLACVHTLLNILFKGKAQGIVPLIEERTKTDQLIVYTRYRDNAETMEQLLKDLKIQVMRIDGRTEADSREDLLEKQFRAGGVSLVTTQQAMDVGVKIISYTGKPISIIYMDPPRSAGHYMQLNGRADRIGQTGNVTIYRVMTHAPGLGDKIIEASHNIPDDWDVILPTEEEQVENAATPIDVTAFKRIDQWSDIFGQLLSRTSTEKLHTLVREARLTDNFGLDVYNDALRVLLYDSPHRIATNFFKTHDGVDFEMLRVAQRDGTAWKRTVECYNFNWQYSASAHTAGALLEICQGIEEKRGKEFNGRVDLGCGAAYMSRTFGQPFACLDMDPLMISIGKEQVEKIIISDPRLACLAGNTYHEKFIQNTGLAEKSSDLVIASYVWQYQAQRMKDGQPLRQLEDALIEANKIIITGGYLLATVPIRTVDDDAFNRLCENASNYGFKNTPLSRTYTPTRRQEVVGGKLVDATGKNRKGTQGFRLFAFKKEDDHVGGYVGTYPDYALIPEVQLGTSIGKSSQPMVRGRHGTLDRRQKLSAYVSEDKLTIRQLCERLEP